MECLLAFHFLFACNLFLQIRLQILQVLSILQLSSILEILLHLQNFFLAQLLTLLSSNRIHSRTDSKHRRPVCRYNAGSRIRICHNIFQHFPFRRHIERRSCFIQQQNRRFSKQCTRNRKPLCLSFLESAAAFFHHTFNTIRQFLHKFPCTCQFQRLHDLFICGFRFHISHIFCNCS